MPCNKPLHQVLCAILPDAGEPAALQLAAHFHLRKFARHAILLHQGEVWSDAWLIDSGLVRMHFLRRDGREFNKNFWAEGALLCPLTPVMWRAPSLFAISAVEPVRAWRCNGSIFRSVLLAHGLWNRLQAELLSSLLDAKLQREHDLLALDGRSRYQTFCSRFPDLAQRVPLKHLATYLGLTDVSLSRLRRQQAGTPLVQAAERFPADHLRDAFWHD